MLIFSAGVTVCGRAESQTPEAGVWSACQSATVEAKHQEQVRVARMDL